jgi:hypothetical protein
LIEIDHLARADPHDAGSTESTGPRNAVVCPGQDGTYGRKRESSGDFKPPGTPFALAGPWSQRPENGFSGLEAYNFNLNIILCNCL